MRNRVLIIILFCLYINNIVAKNPVKNFNYIIDDSLNFKVFNFEFSQKGWRYSTFDSTFVDYNNVIKDTAYLDGNQFIHTHLLSIKLGLTVEEKFKIYILSNKVEFYTLPNHIELKNIFYFRSEFEQTISMSIDKVNHVVIWDGIYPDLGNNTYVIKHRKLVNRYKELCDTIYSILIRKVELQELYPSNGMKKNPINVQGVNLKKIGFPNKHIPRIGKYTWGFTVS